MSKPCETILIISGCPGPGTTKSEIRNVLFRPDVIAAFKMLAENNEPGKIETHRRVWNPFLGGIWKMDIYPRRIQHFRAHHEAIGRQEAILHPPPCGAPAQPWKLKKNKKIKNQFLTNET